MSRLVQRGIGVILMGAILFTLDIAQETVWHALILPVLLGIAAYLITQSLMAVALAVATLAFANADLDAEFWVTRWAYPGIAIVAAAVCVCLAAARFIARVRDTRAARWAHRQRQT